MKMFAPVTLFLVLLIPNAYAGSFEVTGKVKGIDKAAAYFEYLDDATGTGKTDSSLVSQGRFSFKGSIAFWMV